MKCNNFKCKYFVPEQRSDKFIIKMFGGIDFNYREGGCKFSYCKNNKNKRSFK